MKKLAEAKLAEDDAVKVATEARGERHRAENAISFDRESRGEPITVIVGDRAVTITDHGPGRRGDRFDYVVSKVAS